MTEALDFQSLIMTLEKFWADNGCLIWQPYHTEVGAGTMNPATSLRVLGPEPWNVGYVEPSIRPDDGRYGENPNRFYQHTQYQVILKPDPGNPQELYLKSLEALGIDPMLHDIRFVEDNWKSPALGAWGLGWEVWLNGLEITQFTYFQQSGGQALDPVSVELTYGLERIAMALQGVRDFKNIRWNDTYTYGDVQLQSEQQFSKYAFELADVDNMREMYRLYEEEANRCLEAGQVLPAHDYVLKCSHTFNLLDTRGAVGVTERAGYFHRMRDLSRKVADAYLEERQRMEFPWLDKATSEGSGEVKVSSAKYPSKPAPFVLEIGTEELPHGDIEDAIQQLEEKVPAALENLRLDYEGLKILATPRRLVVEIEKLADRQEDLEQTVKGPPQERAYDDDGKPTRAAEGFASSKGVSVEDLEIHEIDGGKYVVAVEKKTGLAAHEVLSAAIPDLIQSIRFGQSMRWNDPSLAFSRPIRWLLALHGEAPVQFSYARLTARPFTRGLRFVDGGKEIAVKSVQDYLAVLEEQGILLDQDQRQQRIKNDLDTLAAKVGGVVSEDHSLLKEVTHLVEAPTALLGKFDPAFLDLPREVLISVMKKHQRYFPVEKDGKLLPNFITIVNKKSVENEYPEMPMITEGNADVILARFADARYFVKADLEKKLADYLPALNLLTFQVDLGSMGDKTKRIRSLVDELAPLLDLSEDDLKITRRAAELCKADLATRMVVEMTSLQGVMGYYYAKNSGEDEATAAAIREHYLPASSGDPAPKTKAGLVVGLADRLDSLAGLFAAGLAPTGSKDPFAQRRAALGLVGNLISWDQDLDLKKALDKAISELPIKMESETRDACLLFISDRLHNYLREQGYAHDVVDAVVAVQGQNPASAFLAVKSLTDRVKHKDWEKTLDSFARCVRITRDLEKTFPVDEKLFKEAAEIALFKAVEKGDKVKLLDGDLDGFFNLFDPLIPLITDFFDNVLVMDEDLALRENRLGLLQIIAGFAEGFLDLTRLEGF
ncbi:MAG TPA: glycine--tRNA ligase subunit beta [Chloroflexi bacterium]|nr:glycine--tRNA ligase subunit beta [Chloroflexota bacterium]